ncbi:ABC transporter substrate-binding protein [Streptantibioticus silvisoli]|uniref:ABC transporter substrate-binding protein n=1 Tax=Streptantibioticus silvisoli TaxID=2705255 RepID=A0ABT6W483_9ACTN|nr:ABC transporter substrate-binding protein [Streptantibioticus silvisoli]MDI5965565.1 ABC transporter substrate-binding protein [Streptantibioticus silvisoli]
MARRPGFPRAWFGRLTVRARVAVAVLCALALAAAGFALSGPIARLADPPCLRGAATTVLHEGTNHECVGITDGAFVFEPGLAAVEAEIRTADQRVVRDHPHDYVSVVMLLPISTAPSSILTMTNTVEQVRGAFVAQSHANDGNVDGDAPYIQLLIGSDGYQANQSAAAAAIIEGDTGRHIAAVAGLGLSLPGTQDAVERLTSRQIPVFGATVTADTYDDIKDFVRVAPDNVNEAEVALDYVADRFPRAVLVEDENGGDAYDATLVKGFRRFSARSGHRVVDIETYNTTDRDRPRQSSQALAQAESDVATRISQMSTNICAAQPAVVLFAGRGRDLAGLLHSFSGVCLDKDITIVSGDDVTNVSMTAQVRHDLGGRVTVEYAGVADPDEWRAASTGHPPAADRTAISDGEQGYATFARAYGALAGGPGFTGASLTDGNTMMAYDSVLTAVSAIRLTEQDQPLPAAVASELGALQGARRVLGSSGAIGFTADYRTSAVGSNPVGKAIPILRLTPGTGGPQVLALKWPDGRPSDF